MSETDDAFLAKHTYLSDGRPENLDERLAREVPDGAETDVPYDRQPDAVGSLVAEPDLGPEDELGEEQDVLATATGEPRADASAEEAAMHLVDEADAWQDNEDYSAFVSDVDEEQADVDGDLSEDEEDDSADRDDDSGEFVFDAEEDEG